MLSVHMEPVNVLLYTTILIIFYDSASAEEGDSCFMKALKGVCTPASKCQSQLDNYIKEGRLTAEDIYSCGLGTHEEIICCPVEIDNGPRSTERPAVIACEKFEEALNVSLSPHILGGIAVERGEYPHMAAIAFATITGGREDYEFRCGGALIEKRFVLTAAHCVHSLELRPLFVRLGVIRLSDPLEASGTDIRIRDIHIHNNYTSSRKYHDIAILELEREVRTSPSIFPACLYTAVSDPPQNGDYYVAGWGTIDERTREKSKLLLKAQLSIVPLDRCNQSFIEYGLNRHLAEGIREGQLCAGDPKFVKDACQGDSGGPFTMVVDPSKKSFRIIGVISSGFGCASKTPGLYTRVAAYLDYIESVVWPSGS